MTATGQISQCSVTYKMKKLVCCFNCMQNGKRIPGCGITYLSPWSWNEDGRSHCKGQIPELPFFNNVLNWYPAYKHAQ